MDETAVIVSVRHRLTRAQARLDWIEMEDRWQRCRGNTLALEKLTAERKQVEIDIGYLQSEFANEEEL